MQTNILNFHLASCLELQLASDKRTKKKRKGIRVGKSISEPKKKVTLLEKDVDDDQYEFLKKYITNMDYVMSQP